MKKVKFVQLRLKYRISKCTNIVIILAEMMLFHGQIFYRNSYKVKVIISGSSIYFGEELYAIKITASH